MKLSAVLQWLDAHWLAIGAVLASLVAAWKAIPAAKREAFERSNPRLVGAVRTLAAVGPDVLGALRIARYQIVAGEPRPSAPTVPPRVIAPDVTRTMRGNDSGSALRGFVALDAMALAAAVFVLAASAAALAGCPLPPQDFCTPRDTRCAPDGVPEVCSSTQRWTRGSPSEPCPAPAACCRTRSPYGGRDVHACVPVSACLPEQPVGDASALSQTQ